MRPVKSVVLSVASLILLSGCIPSQQELAMSRDLEEMKRRLATVQREMAAQQTNRTEETRQRLDEVTRNQAEIRAQIDNMRLELQSYNGRFADLEQKRSELQDELALVRDDLGMRLSALEETSANQSVQGSPTTATPAAAQQQTTPAPPPETLYLQAVELIRKEKQYDAGRKQLDTFLQRFPQHNLAANAVYWIGESYVSEKKYDEAILKFEDLIQTYGDHPKVAAAYLKQALTFDKTGDRQAARTILDILIERFPLSDEARIAKERLQTWSQ